MHRRQRHLHRPEQQQYTVEHRIRPTADEIIRRAVAKGRVEASVMIHEANINRPNRSKEIIERLVTAIKNHERHGESYIDEGWY